MMSNESISMVTVSPGGRVPVVVVVLVLVLVSVVVPIVSVDVEPVDVDPPPPPEEPFCPCGSVQAASEREIAIGIKKDLPFTESAPREAARPSPDPGRSGATRLERLAEAPSAASKISFVAPPCTP
jgi:hypothetical protein